jgi:tyrosyl-tRNA synthetase
MEVDLELGGTDQTFNMLAGRTLMKAMKNKDKFVMTTPLLTDSEGRKIGKTEGNVIALTDSPNDLYAKVMALSDDLIVKGLEYLTDIPMDKVRGIEEKLKSDENPIQYKKSLAFEITKQLYGENDAQVSQEHFEKTVQTKEVVPFAAGLVSQNSLASLSTVLVDELKVISSNSEYKRLINQGGIKINGEVITNPNLGTASGDLVSVGKRDNFKIEVKK